MTKEEILRYKDKTPIGVYSIGLWDGIEILDVVHGINDYVVYRFSSLNNSEPHKAKIRYGARYASFRTVAGYSVRVDKLKILE